MSTPESHIPSPEGSNPDSPHTDGIQPLPIGLDAQGIPDNTIAHPITLEYLEALERETPEEREARAKAARARREAEDREMHARAKQNRRSDQFESAWALPDDDTMTHSIFYNKETGYVDPLGVMDREKPDPSTGSDSPVDPTKEQDPNQP